jgi:hypothetical protein
MNRHAHTSIAGVAFTLLMLSISLVSSASPITYSVNRTVGIGSVTGSIQTDGTLGVLTAASITDWDLHLTDGTNTFELTGPLSGNDSVVFIQGTDVSATATQLLYNFSAADAGLFLFQQGLFSGTHYYCDGAPGNFACLAGESVVPLSIFVPGYVNIAQQGNQVIGTARGGNNSVPEPSTIILMLTGVGLLLLRNVGMGCQTTA